MKIKLLNDKPLIKYNTKEQCCLNRGVKEKELQQYLSNSFNNIYPPSAFGEELMNNAARVLIKTIQSNKTMWVCVDSDVDGLTSAAILINYLYELFPTWTINNLKWNLHKGKGHGLNEFIDTLIEDKYDLVVCPDSATNDIKEIEKLHEIGTNVLILDHHLLEVPSFSPYAIVINSQYNYPNQELSGAGVVLKFCQYIDGLLGKNKANNFLDLASVGLQSDMMEITNLETKEMIFEGLQEYNIHNPLIYSIIQKNEFAMSKADYIPSPHNSLEVTPMGISFFLTPLLNAVCRSGTMEEKELTFKAMLTHYAYQEIPSTKRGHKIGEMETIVTQMTRQIGNIKNRQTREEEKILELLETKIKNEEMLNNKVLVFCLKPGEAEPNVRGLAANKMMARYQRPVCVVTQLENGTYAGSMRGYTATGIESFKDVAETSKACELVVGHHNAAGIFLNNPNRFVEDMNVTLKDISTEIVYYVDYIWDASKLDNQAIIDLAEMNDYLGQGFSRPLVYIKNCKIDNYMIMKDTHLKINLPSGASAVMWGVDENLKNRINNNEEITINFVAKCNINNWNGNLYPQLIIEDFEEVKYIENYIEETKQLDILDSWGF